MVAEFPVKLTINFNDPDLDPEERDQEVQNLLNQLSQANEVEAVERVFDPNPPKGNKTLGGFLVDLLTVEVSIGNFKKLMGFLGDRLGSKPIKLKLKTPDGRELEVETSSQAEFELAMQKAQEFLEIR